MAGNLSGSELLGACGKYVEGISEVPTDCLGHCHYFQSSSVLRDTEKPLSLLTNRKFSFKEPPLHCGWTPFFLLNPTRVLPKPPYVRVWSTATIQETKTVEIPLLAGGTQSYLKTSFDSRITDTTSHGKYWSKAQCLIPKLVWTVRDMHKENLIPSPHYYPRFQPALHQWPGGQGRQSSFCPAPGTSLIVLAGHGIGNSEPSRQ